MCLEYFMFIIPEAREHFAALHEGKHQAYASLPFGFGTSRLSSFAVSIHSEITTCAFFTASS
jgi:hypothetical protein